MATIPIQRRMPIPPRDTVRRPRKRSKYPLDTMKRNDWIFVPAEVRERKGLAAYVSKVGRTLGMQFSTRKLMMLWNKDHWITVPVGYRGTKAVAGTGVWRVA